MFYLLDDTGNIASFADYKFDENAIETKEEIVQGYDGKYYFESQCPEPSLTELKEAKREEINSARDAEEQGGFLYKGKVFDSDPISCIRISSAAQAMQMATMAEEVPTITWTCQDNSTIDLTAAELMGLVVALAEWSNTCHQKATQIKTLLEECQTLEEEHQG